MISYKVNALPYSDSRLNEWRENFRGIRVHHEATNFIVFGAVDDIWVDSTGKLIVVDYKATSTSEEITLESEYRQSYKRQLEIYQWLLRQSELEVSDTAYILYANAQKTQSDFHEKLHFDMQLIQYIGDTSWVEPIVFAAHACLQSDNIADPEAECEYCNYRISALRYDK